MSNWLACGVLAAMLAAACVTDWRRRRIPNVLCLAAALAGLLLHAASATGREVGLQWLSGGGSLLHALGGLLLALAVGAALWRLGLFGAGDAKLLAALGAWTGPFSVLPLVLMTLLAGGVLATAALAAQAWKRRALRPLPYSLALAAGVSALVGVRAAGLAP